jgi:hypothetical protein
MASARFSTILKTLTDHQVEFVVVGGVAAVLRGATISTFDLDIVHSTEPKNVSRLLAALQDLDARYRYKPEHRPDSSHLATQGHQLLVTREGPLDVLGAIGKNRQYADLLPHAPKLEISEGLQVPVLDLETQIGVKEELGGEKDRMQLPVLRRTLKEQSKGGSDPS